MPTLYQFEHSPFCIPFPAIFKSLGLRLRVVDVPYWDRSRIIKLTGGAYYQAPVIEDGKTVVYESRPDSQDVARYVDTHFAGGRLFPAPLDGLQSIIIAYLENDVEGVTFKLVDPKYIAAIPDLVQRTMVIRHKERKFGRGCIEQWKKEAPQLRAEAVRVLQPFEDTFRHMDFIFGGEPVYADFLLFGIIGNLTFRKYNSIPPGLKALAAWEKRMHAFRFA
jgi:glutathione S-transferase